MPDLSLHKNAQRLRIYISESDRWRGAALEAALLDTLRTQGMAGATVFRGAAGFGAHSHIHTTRIEVLSIDLPVVLEVVDTVEKITTVLDVIYPMVREGLITVEDVQIVKYTHRYRNPLPADRLVSEVMTSPVVAFPAELTVKQAWQQMLDHRLKAAPVLDASGKVVGIVTDEDLMQRAGIQQRLSVALRLDRTEINDQLIALEPADRIIADVMTHPVTTVIEDETLAAATARMVKTNLKRLPVIDHHGNLVGILSRLDVLRAVAQAPLPIPLEPLHPQAVQTVGDIMTSAIPMVSQDDDLATVIDKFAQSSSHRLIVVDAAGAAVGLISDSDVVARVQPAQRKNILTALRQIGKPAPGKETAFDLMSPGPLTSPPNLSVAEAVKRLLNESRKWLVVVNEDGKPLGLVDRQLLLEAVASIYHVS